MLRPEGGVDWIMYAALHGLPGVPPASLDAMCDLEEIDQVGQSSMAAKNRNLDAARNNAPNRKGGK